MCVRVHVLCVCGSASQWAKDDSKLVVRWYLCMRLKHMLQSHPRAGVVVTMMCAHVCVRVHVCVCVCVFEFTLTTKIERPAYVPFLQLNILYVCNTRGKQLEVQCCANIIILYSLVCYCTHSGALPLHPATQIICEQFPRMHRAQQHRSFVNNFPGGTGPRTRLVLHSHLPGLHDIRNDTHTHTGAHLCVSLARCIANCLLKLPVLSLLSVPVHKARGNVWHHISIC